MVWSYWIHRQVTTGKGKRRRTRTQRFTRVRTDQTRTGIRYKITPVIEQQSLGSRVVSVEHIQNMRSRNVEFAAQKMKLRLVSMPSLMA